MLTLVPNIDLAIPAQDEILIFHFSQRRRDARKNWWNQSLQEKRNLSCSTPI